MFVIFVYFILIRVVSNFSGIFPSGFLNNFSGLKKIKPIGHKYYLRLQTETEIQEVLKPGSVWNFSVLFLD